MTDKEREYLIREIKSAISIMSDEKEPGSQGVINIEDINACDPDYVPFELPPLSSSDIISMLHLDDPEVNPEITDRPEDESDTPLIDKSPSGSDPTKDMSESGYLPDDGMTSDSLAGDLGEAPDENKKYDDGLDIDSDWNNIRVPDNVEPKKIAQSIIDDDTIGQNKIIIEFATPSLQDERDLDFHFFVKPGDQLTEDTLIARAKINDVTKDIRSIFSAGTVCATPDGSDYERLYKGCGCDRHIIIENYEICGERPDIDTDRIQQLCDEFTQEAYIHSLVTDNLPDCVLPLILQNRYTKYKWIIKILGIRENRPNGREIFSKYIDEVQNIRKQYMEDMQYMGTEENIKNTNGNVRKVNELGWSIIDRRRKYAEDMVYMYREYVETLPPCEYDENNYYDCQFLAYDHDVKYRDKEVNEKVGNTEYSNYYMALLSKIDMAASTNNQYAKEYFELLTNIIERRMSYESYDINVIIKEFDNLFKKSINKKYKNAYNNLSREMKLKESDITFMDVYDWITAKTTKGSTKDSDEYMEYSKRQLANIFLFIWNYHEYDLESKRPDMSYNSYDAKETTILDLTKLEWKELSEFWDKVLAIWETISVKQCCNNFEEFARLGDKYHEWPTPGYISIGYDNYTHYLFQNYPERDQTIEDEDYGTACDMTTPEVPEDIEIPPGEFGPEDLLKNENDPQIGEISIIDFKYWVKYFALATIISIPYLNCGLDIIPFIQLVPLPCIFIAVASVYIKILDIVIVFGITIRGMYIFPCVLYVNCSSVPLSITTALIAALKTIQSKINAKINSLAEKPITSLADGFKNLMEKENRRLRNENMQLDAAISNMKARKVKNMENIRRMFKKQTNPDDTLREQINDPIGAMFAQNALKNK